MRLQRSRRLALSVGVGLIGGTVLPIAAATVSTLTPEALTGGSTAPTNFGLCPTATSTVSGTASSAYPGTFVETGTITWPTLTATFAITSAGTGTSVTGSMTQGSRFTASCGPASGG